MTSVTQDTDLGGMESFTFQSIVSLMSEGRRWVIGSVLAFTFSAVAYAFLTTPIYRVEVLLAPMSGDSQAGLSALVGNFGGLASLAGVDLVQGGGQKEEAVATLRSNELAKEFILEHDLLPMLFADEWDPDKKKWRSENGDEPTIWDGIKRFGEEVRYVSEDRNTGLVTLAIEWKDRQAAADWAAGLVGLVNETMRNRALAESQRSLAYLESQLKVVASVEVKDSIYSLIEGQIKNMMLVNSRPDYSFRIIDPPIVPDADDFHKPSRALLIALGLFVGMLVGVFIVLFKRAWSLKPVRI